MEGSLLAERLLAVLPQTQCTRCGYPDCAGYASAMALGKAAINQCPPGGTQGIDRLARLTGQAPLPLNPDNGTEGQRSLVCIDEAWCIGCTLCAKVCPTDAILGSNKLMHTVIEAYCTGCELCLPVCPVDCIVLENASGERTGWDAWSQQQADVARTRHAQRSRSARAPMAEIPECGVVSAPSTATAVPEAPGVTPAAAGDSKRRVIEEALRRARSRQPLPGVQR